MLRGRRVAVNMNHLKENALINKVRAEHYEIIFTVLMIFSILNISNLL